jgi:hypothetical protein
MNLSNLIPSPDDAKDFPFIPHLGPYADVIDMRPQASPVDNQDIESDCTDKALVNGCERFAIANNLPFEDLSDQFVYDITGRWESLEGQPGRFLRDALRCAHQIGVPKLSDWPFRDSDAWLEPPDSVIVLAGQRKVGRYERIDMTGDWPLKAQRLWAALDRGLSVVIAMRLGQKFYNIIGPIGQQYYNTVGSPGNEFIGNHAMWLAGKMTGSSGSFFCKNSWGTAWGDDGYFELSQVVVSDVLEAWAILGFDGVDPTTQAKHDWALANPALVAQWVNAHSANVQEIIDGAIDSGLSSTEFENIMGWVPGRVWNYSQNDSVGKTLDWREFNWR